jgi:hypothetical protein
MGAGDLELMVHVGGIWLVEVCCAEFSRRRCSTDGRRSKVNWRGREGRVLGQG